MTDRQINFESLLCVNFQFMHQLVIKNLVVNTITLMTVSYKLLPVAKLFTAIKFLEKLSWKLSYTKHSL